MKSNRKPFWFFVQAYSLSFVMTLRYGRFYDAKEGIGVKTINNLIQRPKRFSLMAVEFISRFNAGICNGH